MANMVKSGFVTTKILADNKDAIDAVSSILTGTILLLGAIFSYFRFFHGRILAVRAKVSVEVSVHESPHDYHLHAVQIAMRNVGPAAIWEPEPELWVTLHGDEPTDLEAIRDWNDLPDCNDPSLVSVIDTGESVMFFYQRTVPKSIWAVTYQVAIRSASGDIWQSGATVSNKPDSKVGRGADD